MRAGRLPFPPVIPRSWLQRAAWLWALFLVLALLAGCLPAASFEAAAPSKAGAPAALDGALGESNSPDLITSSDSPPRESESHDSAPKDSLVLLPAEQVDDGTGCTILLSEPPEAGPIAEAAPGPAGQDASAVLSPPGPESWPSFRNGSAQLGVAKTKLPEPLVLKWKFPASDGVPGTAAIVGGRVYVGLLKGELVCLNLQSGEPVWSYRSIDDPDPKAFAPGFKAGCLVTTDAVYIGDEDGMFHAVDRATGRKRWTFTTQGEIAGCASPVGEHIIVGSHDSFLYCLNAADGKEVWKFQTQDRVNCSPAVVDGFTFVAGCDEHLRVIDVQTGKQRSDIPLESYLIASPAVLGDMLYVGTYASEVVAVDWKNEKIVWRYKDVSREFPYHASAAVTDKFVVVGGRDKQMHCIDRVTGRGVWTFPTRGRIDSSPAIVGERVYFGSSDRNIYGVNLADGKEVWKFNAEGEITAGIAVGEGHLVVGSEGSQGYVYCFGAE